LIPRALPWAGMDRPFGAHDRGAPLQGADIDLIPRLTQAVGLGWGRSPLKSW